MQVSDLDMQEFFQTLSACYARARNKSRYNVLGWVAHIYGRLGKKNMSKFIQCARQGSAFSTISEVMMINDAFDTVKRLSESGGDLNVDNDIQILRYALQDMREANMKAAKVVEESDKVSVKLEEICDYIEGTRENL